MEVDRSLESTMGIHVPRHLSEIEPACAQFLLANAPPSYLQRNDIAVGFGEHWADVLVVYSGVLLVRTQDPRDGVKPVRYLGPGHVMGHAFIPEQSSNLEIVVLENCTLRRITTEAIVQAFQRWPLFALGYSAYFARQIFNRYQVHALHARSSFEVNLSYLLWGLASDVPGVGRVLTRRLSQSSLGEYFGVPREEVNRRLKYWERADFIERLGDGLLLSLKFSELFSELTQLEDDNSYVTLAQLPSPGPAPIPDRPPSVRATLSSRL